MSDAPLTHLRDRAGRRRRMSSRPSMKSWMSMMWRHRHLTDADEWRERVAFEQLMLANGFDRRAPSTPDFPAREMLD